MDNQTVCVKRAVVRNEAGIHVRPSGVIVEAVAGYPGTIRLRTASTETSLDSVLALISLGLCTGEWVEVAVSGPEEEAMCAKIVELFERRYDFTPKTP